MEIKLRIFELSRESRSYSEKEMVRRFNAKCFRLGVVPPTIKFSERVKIDSPFAASQFNAIIFPPSWLECGFDKNDLDSICSHELAHIMLKNDEVDSLAEEVRTDALAAELANNRRLYVKTFTLLRNSVSYDSEKYAELDARVNALATHSIPKDIVAIICKLNTGIKR